MRCQELSSRMSINPRIVLLSPCYHPFQSNMIDPGRRPHLVVVTHPWLLNLLLL